MTFFEYMMVMVSLIMALAPGLTVTEFHSRLGADFTKEQGTWMHPEEVVDESLGALGKGPVVCIPGLKRRFIMRLASMLPRFVYYKIMKVVGEKVKKRWDEIEKKSWKHQTTAQPANAPDRDHPD